MTAAYIVLIILVGPALTEQFGKQFHLTEAGEAEYRYARSILQQVDEMDDVLNRIKGFSGGRLKIAAISSANYFAPKLLGSFYQRFPDVSVSMEVTNQKAVLGLVIDNEVDMAIMGQPPKDSQVEAIPFMENPLVIVAAPEHRLAKRKRIQLKELEKQNGWARLEELGALFEAEVRAALAAADTECRQASFRVPALHAVEQRDENARAGSADRVTDRDGATMDVDLVEVPAEFLVDGDRLGREGSVRFDEIQLVDVPASLLETFAGRRDGPGTHDGRVDAGAGECPFAKNVVTPGDVFFQRRSALVLGAEILAGHGPFLAETPAEFAGEAGFVRVETPSLTEIDQFVGILPVQGDLEFLVRQEGAQRSVETVLQQGMDRFIFSCLKRVCGAPGSGLPEPSK